MKMINIWFLPISVMQNFDFSRLNFQVIFDSFLSLFIGLTVGWVMYHLFLKKYRGVKLKHVLLTASLSAFLESFVLDMIQIPYVYLQFPSPYQYFTVPVNAILISFLSVLIYWQVVTGHQANRSQ